jgi:hypothetical protein
MAVFSSPALQTTEARLNTAESKKVLNVFIGEDFNSMSNIWDIRANIQKQDDLSQYKRYRMKCTNWQIRLNYFDLVSVLEA